MSDYLTNVVGLLKLVYSLAMDEVLKRVTPQLLLHITLSRPSHFRFKIYDVL
jgi:hypothetical protein